MSGSESGDVVVEKNGLAEEEGGGSLTAAQRARAERQRLRARALQDARLIHRPQSGDATATRVGPQRPIDTGGGFLLEAPADAVQAAPTPVHPAAPLVHVSEQPHCELCDHPFPQSYLFDTFDFSVCDSCRDDDDAHSLITRTEAKSDYLLKDCDLDMRPPALKCVRRRNPHRARFADMRLYLRVQVERRALEVWGTEEALEEERERRSERSERARVTAEKRRLRALRMDVRSSLFERTRPNHQHDFGPEKYDESADEYKRECRTCGHIESYEKM